MTEYYSPRAKKRWCLSLYDNVGHHSLGVFPQAAMVSFSIFSHIQKIYEKCLNLLLIAWTIFRGVLGMDGQMATLYIIFLSKPTPLQWRRVYQCFVANET